MICYSQKVFYAMCDLTDSVGIDELLAKHYAHLFIRDPLVIYAELLDQKNDTSSDHFEVRYLIHGFDVSFIEHSINELADDAVQASSTEL